MWAMSSSSATSPIPKNIMGRLSERYVFDWNRIYGKDGYHVEYSVTDICNRNCISCSHLAPLAKHANYVSAEEFARVTGILHDCLPDIHTFWLTGGEPTLHPDFIGLLKIARRIYDEAYIGIYSNGTTLEKYERDEAFWKFIRENGIVWGITVYESDFGYYEDMFKRHDCENNFALVRIGNWFTNLTVYSKNQPVSREKYEKCGWERCKINVRNGRIYNCPSCEFADLFNGYFGEKLTVTLEDYLPVDESLTREKIIEFKSPQPFCRQCNLELRGRKFFPNMKSKKVMEEWADTECIKD